GILHQTPIKLIRRELIWTFTTNAAPAFGIRNQAIFFGETAHRTGVILDSMTTPAWILTTRTALAPRTSIITILRQTPTLWASTTMPTTGLVPRLLRFGSI